MRLVATGARWAVGVGVVAAGFALAVEAFATFAHTGRSLESYGGLLAVFTAAEAVLVLVVLQAEESRLARELRTARTGSPALREMALERRQRAPLFARLFTSRLGTAAVLVAEGDRDGALDLLAGGSPLMRGGRLEKLRAVVDADVERAGGSSVDLERCVHRLRALPPIGHREADLYRVHVLVKALLEQADAEGAEELARALEAAPGEDEHVYAAWLRVWFQLDLGDPGEGGDVAPWRPLGEGDLRVAILLARAHGAVKLVEGLEERLAAVAPPQRR